MITDTTDAREQLLQAVSPIPEDLAVVFDRMVAARRATGLYQEDHPIAVGARDEACLALESALRERVQVVLTAKEGGLFVDNRAYRQNADTEALAKRMRQHGILSMTFKAGVDASELSILLSAMDLSAARLRAKGGVRQILVASGVTHIETEDMSFAEEVANPEDEIHALQPEVQWDETLAELARLLCEGGEGLDEETYDKLIQVLGDPVLTLRLFMECLTYDAPDAPDEGRPSIVGDIIQHIERIVLARSSATWEEVKANVRAAVAKLPPSVRPRILAFRAGSIGQGPPPAEEMEPYPGADRLPQMLQQLGSALAEARNLPRDLADAFVGLDHGDRALNMLGANARIPASRLAMVINGMAAAKFEPMSPWHEMVDMLQSARGQTTLADAVMTLLEVLDSETKLDGYSKVATELERKTREMMDRNQSAPALIALSSLARHANESNDYPAWQRLRAKAALEAIGIEHIVQFVGQIIRIATPQQAETATELLIFLGEAAAPMLTQLMAEPLLPGADTAVAEALVRLGDRAVPELCRTLSSTYSQVGQSIVRVLSRINTPKALEGLGKALVARDILVRLAAVQALGRTEPTAAARMLLPALNDHNISIRRAAIAALGDLRCADAVPELARMALIAPGPMSHDVGDQIEAVAALGKIGGGAAISALARVLKLRSWFRAARLDDIRCTAAASLKRIGTAECLDVIAGHTRDRRRAVRAACAAIFEEQQISLPAAHAASGPSSPPPTTVSG